MIIVFDTETTGVPKNYKAPVTDTENWPRLVQLAFAVHHPVSMARAFEANLIIKPEGFSIPVEASDIHGITTREAEVNGVDLVIAMNLFCRCLEVCDTIVGHNIGFDEKIMGAEMVRTGIKPAKADRTKICTMNASTKFCALPAKNGRGYKWPKLQELHKKLFDSEFDGAHDAMEDVNATVRCFYALKERGII